MVHDEYARSLSQLATMHPERTDAYDDVDAAGLRAHKPVIVDVITLDSTSCAPCQYMMEAVSQAAETRS